MCFEHNENHYKQMSIFSRRHRSQQTGYLVLNGFQNVRLLNTKVEDVLKLIEDHERNLMFREEAWQDPVNRRK